MTGPLGPLAHATTILRPGVMGKDPSARYTLVMEGSVEAEEIDI